MSAKETLFNALDFQDIATLFTWLSLNPGEASIQVEYPSVPGSWLILRLNEKFQLEALAWDPSPNYGKAQTAESAVPVPPPTHADWKNIIFQLQKQAAVHPAPSVDTMWSEIKADVRLAIRKAASSLSIEDLSGDEIKTLFMYLPTHEVHYGDTDVMAVDQFCEDCENGCLTDYDGSGALVIDHLESFSADVLTGDDPAVNIAIQPGWPHLSFKLKELAKKLGDRVAVAWYNK